MALICKLQAGMFLAIGRHLEALTRKKKGSDQAIVPPTNHNNVRCVRGTGPGCSAQAPGDVACPSFSHEVHVTDLAALFPKPPERTTTSPLRPAVATGTFGTRPPVAGDGGWVPERRRHMAHLWRIAVVVAIVAVHAL